MTDCIDATACAVCGRTALFDGVELIRTNQEGKRGVWECLEPCDERMREKAPRSETISKKGKNIVRIKGVWTNSLLERLSTRLSTRTSNLEQSGSPGNTSCPTHYCYDLMIPLALARKKEPMGWVLFGAKYLHDKTCVEALGRYIAKELPDHRYAVSLVDLVLDCYCMGVNISGRSLRRKLDIGRGVQAQYHKAMKDLLDRFHAVEENYSRIVKTYL